MVWNVDVSTHTKADHWRAWVKSEKKLQAYARSLSPTLQYNQPQLPRPGDFVTSSTKGFGKVFKNSLGLSFTFFIHITLRQLTLPSANFLSLSACPPGTPNPFYHSPWAPRVHFRKRGRRACAA
jgi:hypothetical protein